MVATWRSGSPLQTYRRLTHDPIGFLSQVTSECGDFARINLGPIRFFLVNDADLIREALVEQSEVLIIKGGVSGGLARLIGKGILTNHGERWRESRRRLQPLFHRTALDAHVPAIVDCVRESLDRWQSRFGGTTFPMNREMLALSFRIMSTTLFRGAASFEDAEAFADAVWVLQRDGMRRYMTGRDFFARVPTPANRRVNGARATLVRLAEDAIRRGADQPVEEILSILFAGTESPANTLCWAMKLLEDHPEWRQTLTDRLSGWNSGTPNRHVEDMDELTQVISETVRLYPAGWAFERFASADTVLGGEPIAKGSRLLFSPFLLHRNRRYWKDPEAFDPCRFALGSFAPTGVPKYGYLPFGAGPRSCIGSRLAWIEMRVILSLLLTRYRWKIEQHPGDSPPTAAGSFKIRFDRPFRVQLLPLTA